MATTGRAGRSQRSQHNRWWHDARRSRQGGGQRDQAAWKTPHAHDHNVRGGTRSQSTNPAPKKRPKHPTRPRPSQTTADGGAHSPDSASHGAPEPRTGESTWGGRAARQGGAFSARCTMRTPPSQQPGRTSTISRDSSSAAARLGPPLAPPAQPRDHQPQPRSCSKTTIAWPTQA